MNRILKSTKIKINIYIGLWVRWIFISRSKHFLPPLLYSEELSFLHFASHNPKTGNKFNHLEKHVNFLTIIYIGIYRLHDLHRYFMFLLPEQSFLVIMKSGKLLFWCYMYYLDYLSTLILIFSISCSHSEFPCHKKNHLPYAIQSNTNLK